jgi:hypothetical protein
MPGSVERTRAVLGALSTACIVCAVPGAVIAKVFDSGLMFYVGSAIIGLGCAGFLVFTAGYWIAALFTEERSSDANHDDK